MSNYIKGVKMKKIKERIPATFIVLVFLLYLLLLLTVVSQYEEKNALLKKELKYTNQLMKEKQDLINSYARFYLKDNNEVEKAQAEAEYWMNLYLDLEGKDYEYVEGNK